jgi:hypothetical protein
MFKVAELKGMEVTSASITTDKKGVVNINIHVPGFSHRITVANPNFEACDIDSMIGRKVDFVMLDQGYRCDKWEGEVNTAQLMIHAGNNGFNVKSKCPTERQCMEHQVTARG